VDELIDNAVDVMANEGTLIIRTAVDDECVLVQIGDTAPGIPDESLQRLFEPFFSTKPVGQGSGLGLDVSWRVVVHRYHGDLRVESVPGDTGCQVRLPVTERS
jgi:signal transduction histidine kinase